MCLFFNHNCCCYSSHYHHLFYDIHGLQQTPAQLGLLKMPRLFLHLCDALSTCALLEILVLEVLMFFSL